MTKRLRMLTNIHLFETFRYIRL